jgi:hypothetical protein
LDDGYRKGGKGKGKFGEAEIEYKPDGIIASNVPAELNTLDALNRHFRKFGEVLKITVQAADGRAFVQFAQRGAAEAAVAAPVLEKPEITLAWAHGDKGKGKKGKGKDRPTHLDRPAAHAVLCANPEVEHRVNEQKRKRDEITNRRSALLGNLTEQLKMVMSKLNAEGLTEAKREALRAMILQIKEKNGQHQC